MPNPTPSINAAINANSNAAKGVGGLEARDGGSDGDFASLVKGALKDAVKTGKESEQLSMQAITDKADINQVVTAVSEAEVTLQTVVAIRDRVIEAYQNIIRMPM